jgi:hypothetical protein
MGDAAADDVELALRARAGCVESFAVLAARHQVAIVHYVVWMLGRGRRRPAASWAVAVAAAGCAILGIGGGLWLVGRPGPTPSVQPPVALAEFALEPPSIDTLPLFDELGAQLLAGTATLAAEAVGLPRWNDLVDAGTAFAPAGDDWPGPATP